MATSLHDDLLRDFVETVRPLRAAAAASAHAKGSGEFFVEGLFATLLCSVAGDALQGSSPGKGACG
jgi:hypothetical protein